MLETTNSPGAPTDPSDESLDWTVRLYRDGDIPAIVALINAADEVDKRGKATTEEDLSRNYASPLSDPPTQVILVDGPDVQGVPAGMPFGYGRIVSMDDEENDERLYQFNLVVHPAVRERGLESVILARLISMAREREAQPATQLRGQVSILSMTSSENTTLAALYAEAGIPAVRHGWTMERSLHDPIDDPQPIPGITFRNYRRPDDNEASLTAFNNSFIDHFEHHAPPQEFWNYRKETPEVRTDLSWLAEIDSEPGTFAGFCICEINDADNRNKDQKEGWIALLGTVRGWRGMGLGRSLLIRGLHSLKSAGMDTAVLGVDSQSLTGANRLYTSVGFKVRSHDTMYKSALKDLKL